jgi:hypothetical protein
MIEFKEIGIGKSINEINSLPPFYVQKGEYNSFTIDASLIDCKNAKLALVKVCGNECTLIPEEVVSLTCLNYDKNSGKGQIGLFFSDKENIEKFTITISEVEVIEFDGGNSGDLQETLNGYGYGFVEDEYGFTIYIDKYYIGETVTATSGAFLSSDIVCNYENDFIGVDFNICEIGCHYLGIAKGDDIIAVSQPINVLDFNDKSTKIVEYYKNGFYNRFRLKIVLGDVEFIVDEEEQKLSSGRTIIKNTIVNEQSSFEIGLYTMQQQRYLLSVLKKGVKILLDGNRESVFIKGEYSLKRNFDMYLATGTLTYSDRLISEDSCNKNCSENVGIGGYYGEKNKTIINL